MSKYKVYLHKYWHCYAIFQPIDVNDPKYFFSSSGTKRMLRVHDCGQKDEGIYSCRVQDKSTQAKLYVSRK